MDGSGVVSMVVSEDIEGLVDGVTVSSVIWGSVCGSGCGGLDERPISGKRG